MKDIKATITDLHINWMAIKKACMTTVRKQAGMMPDDIWKKKLLICRHSPIRRGFISWAWEKIPYCISTHFVRHHEGCEKYIGTSRADRTEVKDRSQRSQMEMVPMEMDANIQALLNISEKRLCKTADPTTIKYWESVLEEIKKYDENVYWACVPSGIAHGGCTEPFSDCRLCNHILRQIDPEDRIDIMKRYDAYHEYKAKVRKKEK